MLSLFTALLLCGRFKRRDIKGGKVTIFENISQELSIDTLESDGW